MLTLFAPQERTAADLARTRSGHPQPVHSDVAAHMRGAAQGGLGSDEFRTALQHVGPWAQAKGK